MEENLKRNTPSSSPERGPAVDSGRCGLTRSDSVESSVTVDSSMYPSFESYYNSDARLHDGSIGWTNEKHNSYLDYLEASFIEQLHHSISLRSLQAQGGSRGPFSSLALPENSCNSVDQFPVLHNGSWKKIKVETNKLFLNGAEDSRNLKNPWIRCFTSSNNYRIDAFTGQESLVGNDTWVKNTSVSTGSVRNTEKVFGYCSSNENLIGNNAEASGQNFVDENEENSSYGPKAKRSKRADEADASCSHQVLPSAKLQKCEVLTVTGNFSERNEKELLSENPENLAPDKEPISIT